MAVREGSEGPGMVRDGKRDGKLGWKIGAGEIVGVRKIL